MSKTIKPFLKYAGGKTSLLPEIVERFPLTFHTYYEPFVGGGALLFSIKPRGAVISDINSELINCYWVIRDSPDKLIEELRSHPVSQEHFYKVRQWDRFEGFELLCPVKRAARFIYLNKTCFNGLYRVNKKGQFNVPYNHRENTTVFDRDLIFRLHSFFISSCTAIYNLDFAEAVSTATQGDFIYLDPPYDTDNAGFTQYAGKFERSEQKRLKSVVDDLNCRGCNFMVSNANTTFISSLYKEYDQVIIKAPRMINSNGNKRGKVEELLIKNY